MILKKSGLVGKVLCSLLVVVVLVIEPTAAFATQIKDLILTDDVSFTINGNSSRFRIDKKKGSVQVADCIVNSVRAHRTTWEIPGEYRNQETIQRVFDLFAQAELVKMPKERLTALSRSEWDYYACAGLAIDFESPKGASQPPIYQKDGQGYGSLIITPLDTQADEALENMIYVRLFIFTNKGKSVTECYMRSEEFYDLISCISLQTYDVKDLYEAQSLEIFGCWGGMEFSMPWHDDEHPYYALVEDQETIRRLVNVFSAGKKWDMRLKTYREWLLRFNMPDGTIKVAYIAEPALAWDGLPMKKWQGSFFLLTGDNLFTIERTPYEAISRSIGLPLHRLE